MRSARPRSTPPLSVLLVDDSAVARLTVARRLRAEGFEVIEQASATGTKSGTVAEIACALLDLDLGDGDGTDVARALLAQRAELPIAFFSAAASADVIEQARKLGHVFTKPGQLEAAVAWVAANAKRG
jgi:DNA-binding response OmpR family regulator